MEKPPVSYPKKKNNALTFTLILISAIILYDICHCIVRIYKVICHHPEVDFAVVAPFKHMLHLV